MSDLTKRCVECNQEFVFTFGEQEFYMEKDLDEPKYCLICRGKKMAEKKFWDVETSEKKA